MSDNGIRYDLLARAPLACWSSSTSFIKYSTASGEDLCAQFGWTEKKRGKGWSAATYHFHELTAIQKTPALIEKFFQRDVKPLKKIVQVLDLFKSGCYLTKIAKKYEATPSQYISISVEGVSRWKLRVEFINSILNIIVLTQKSKGVYGAKRKWDLLARIDLTCMLAYLNYVKYYEKEKNNVLILALSIFGLVAKIACKYFDLLEEANKDQPSKSSGL